MSTIPELPIRNFRISDTKAIQDCRVTKETLAADLPNFTELTEDINEEWMQEWENEIQAAEASATDDMHQDILTGLTDAVLAKMDLCRRKNAQLKFAVMRAFPNNVGKYNEFGFRSFRAVRNNDAALQLYMERLYKHAQDNQAALTAVKWTVEDTNTIDAVAQELRVADNAQEAHKNLRSQQTQERITIYNAMWARRQLIAQAARILYMDDYGRYQKYLLPASESSPEDFAIMGVAQNAADNTPLEYVEVRIDSLDLVTLTDETGTYGIADNIPPGTYTLTFTKEGFAAFETEISVSSADETLTVNANLVAM